MYEYVLILPLGSGDSSGDEGIAPLEMAQNMHTGTGTVQHTFSLVA